MISPEELFVRRFDDVGAGLRARDNFERLKLAATLRQLLIDERPLLHAANKAARIKYRFLVNDVGTIGDIPATPDLVFHGHGLDPSKGETASGTKALTLDQFLAVPVLESPHRNVSVREVIQFIANKAGGVHFDASRTGADTDLEALLGTVSAFGVDSVAMSLDAIAQITLDALKPLRSAIVHLPTEMQLLAHYTREIGSIEFDGRGNVLCADLSRQLAEGWSLHAILRVMPQALPGERVLYELGNSDSAAPQFTLLTDDAGDLFANVQLGQNEPLELRAAGYRRTVMFNRFAYVALQIALRAHGAAQLFINNQLAASAEVKEPPQLSTVTRQCIGADIRSERHAAFQVKEIVIANMVLDAAVRAKLANYFWLQWHG